jgi:hypothetical protein
LPSPNRKIKTGCIQFVKWLKTLIKSKVKIIVERKVMEITRRKKNRVKNKCPFELAS